MTCRAVPQPAVRSCIERLVTQSFVCTEIDDRLIKEGKSNRSLEKLGLEIGRLIKRRGKEKKWGWSAVKPLPSAKRYRLILEAIQDYIIDKNLRPGDRLPTEMELVELLQVSRASVREALKSLEVLGVIETRAGEGTFVRSFNCDPIIQYLPYSMLFDRDDLVEIMEIRTALELANIEKAVANMTKAHLAKMRKVLDEMQTAVETNDIRAYVNADGKLHRIIYEPVSNSLLLKLLDIFWKLIKNAKDFNDLTDPDMEASYQRHLRIYDAITLKDSELVKKLLREHFRFSEERIKSTQLPTSEAADAGDS